MHFITHTHPSSWIHLNMSGIPTSGRTRTDWHLRGYSEMHQGSLLVTTGSTPLAMFRNSTNSIYPPYNITPAAPPRVFYKVVEGLAPSSSVPNSQETRSLSMRKENPWQQNEQPSYARKNRCSNIQHYRSIAQNNTKMHSLCKLLWTGTILTPPWFMLTKNSFWTLYGQQRPL